MFEHLRELKVIYLFKTIEKKEESKEDEKVEKPEDDLKPQNLDDSLNIDDIFSHKN